MTAGPGADETSRRHNQVSGRARTNVAACAGITAVLLVIAAARAANHGEADRAAVATSGQPGDTSADLVLGQLNFTNDTANLVDGLRFDMLLPNRFWFAVFSARRRGDLQEPQPTASGWLIPTTTGCSDGPVSPRSAPTRRRIL